MILFAVVGALLLLGGGRRSAGRGGELPNTTTGSRARAPTRLRDRRHSRRDAAPTAEELEEFASSYVSTAADDPDAGFALLTPDYQARSPEYADFWGRWNPEILDVKADPPSS